MHTWCESDNVVWKSDSVERDWWRLMAIEQFELYRHFIAKYTDYYVRDNNVLIPRRSVESGRVIHFLLAFFFSYYKDSLRLKFCKSISHFDILFARYEIRYHKMQDVFNQLNIQFYRRCLPPPSRANKSENFAVDYHLDCAPRLSLNIGNTSAVSSTASNMKMIKTLREVPSKKVRLKPKFKWDRPGRCLSSFSLNRPKSASCIFHTGINQRRANRHRFPGAYNEIATNNMSGHAERSIWDKYDQSRIAYALWLTKQKKEDKKQQYITFLETLGRFTRNALLQRASRG